MKVTQWGRAITCMLPALLPVSLTCLWLRLWRSVCLLVCSLSARVHACGGVRVCVCVCVWWGYADRVLEDRLFPCCSPQRLWLSALPRTETSASSCFVARRPYWWAAACRHRRTSCHGTPRVVDRTGKESKANFGFVKKLSHATKIEFASDCSCILPCRKVRPIWDWKLKTLF